MKPVEETAPEFKVQLKDTTVTGERLVLTLLSVGKLVCKCGTEYQQSRPAVVGIFRGRADPA